MASFALTPACLPVRHALAQQSNGYLDLVVTSPLLTFKYSVISPTMSTFLCSCPVLTWETPTYYFHLVSQLEPPIRVGAVDPCLPPPVTQQSLATWSPSPVDCEGFFLSLFALLGQAQAVLLFHFTELYQKCSSVSYTASPRLCHS